ncbi:MAG TPA: secretin N-terminal domain-containing protein [Sedimentisphaerales bacterium]|nr:secretin N-terminal domain-containing protein [Sedimentisphaerales bacterium]
MRSCRISIVGLVLTTALIVSSGVVAAQEASGPSSQGGTDPVEVVKTNGEIRVKLNFQDAPLQTVLEYLSETAGLTIVSDEVLSDGRMTVISRQPIPLVEAVALINSILKEKGLTTVLTAKTLKVVTLANAKKENIPVLTGRDPNAVVPGDSVVTYVIPVAHVTAVALKENLEALRPEYASIEANEDGNALIITDTTANIKRLMQIVVALDTHMASVAEIRVFRLTNATAASTATLINNIFQQQAQGTNRNRTNNRAGATGGPFEMMMQMRGGDRGGRGATTGGTSQTGQAGGSMNVQMVAAADEQTNSVVVRGPSEALMLVEEIIESLDDRTAKVADVRVFQLRYADATNTADVINQLFNQSQSSTTSRNRTNRNAGGGDMGPMMFRGPFAGPGGEGQQAEGSTMVQVTAAADSRTNTVVVTGPEAVLKVVEGVIAKLDSPIANVADVKVFHLQYADATNTAELINEVFGQQSSSSSRTSRNTQQNQQVSFQRGGMMGGMMGGRGGMMGGQTGQAGGGGGGSISDVSVIASADSRTNSVVVSGPPETLEIIAQIIKELDENPEQERRIFVYPLENANATNLMTILNNLFTQMAALESQGTSSRGAQQFQGQAARGGAGQAAAGGTTSSSSDNNDDLSEETYFEADPNTNSLLCMTSTKNYEKIKPIIEELDRPVGQVLIKVLFAEVTHSNTLDLGTEFSMLNIRSDGGSTESIGIFGKPTTLTTEGGVSSPTGLSIRTLQGDLDFTLRALQETGKLNVLSRPYVLTRNNQMATITVAEEVPIPTGTTTVAGQSQVTIDYRSDIGIVLEVTPSINRKGLVNMTVVPKITTRSAEKVQVSETLSAEAFSTRSASTRVAVLDGQTIVIGGLIEDQVSESVKKVPLLGDIPVAGMLFRRTITSKSKTELLIFLTPYVADMPDALVPIAEHERSLSNIDKDPEASKLFQKHMEAMKGPDKAPTESDDK